MPELEAVRSALADTRAGTAFDIVLVTDNTGALVAGDWSETVAPDSVTGLLALAQRVTDDPNNFNVLAESGESHFFDWDGRQVVCRPFEVADQPWLLVALAPPRGSYKQALGRLIKQIQTELAPESPKSNQSGKKPRTKRKTSSG
jgi:hypothetical protein